MTPSPRDIKMSLPAGGSIPRVGKLRLGVKVERMKNDKAYSFPSAVDYFVVNEDASTNRQSAESFHAVYGDEPRELDVVLPAPRTEDVLEGSWRMYGGGGKMKRKCNGEECVTRDDDGNWHGPMACACAAAGEPLEIPNPRGQGVIKNPQHCTLRWTLTVMLMRVAGVGCWQLDTGSVMAGEGLTASLRLMEQFRGHLQGAQATLRVVPRQGKSGTVYIAELSSLDITPQQALAIASENAQRVTLPDSTLDDETDPLLDGSYELTERAGLPAPSPEAARDSASAGRAPSTPVAPEAAQTGAPLDYDPVTPVIVPTGELRKALAALNAYQRDSLFAECGITAGTLLKEVRNKLWIKWAELGLPDDQEGEPVPITILGALYAKHAENRDPVAAEAFQHFADTGENIDPGDQASLA